MIGTPYQKKVAAAVAAYPRNLAPVVEKELLHYEILKFLSANGYLDKLVFMGGTSLRLCHGGVRYSEDLDFVIKDGFDINAMRTLGASLKEHFEQDIGVNLNVNEPKYLKTGERNTEGINVDKWHFSFETNLHRRDLPRQKVKMEVADVPAYTSVPTRITNNYPVYLSDNDQVVLYAESLEEILADKVVAFNATGADRIRYRDIWDIQWLLSKGTTLNMDLVSKKIKDYQIQDMHGKVATRLAQLPDIILGETFSAEMQRFLEPDVLQATLKDTDFKNQCIQKMTPLLERVCDSLDPPHDELSPS